MLGYIREFQPGLILDEVEDIIDREVLGVKAVKSSIFTIVGGASSLGIGARCPLACFLKLSVCYWDPHVKRSLWSAFCLA